MELLKCLINFHILKISIFVGCSIALTIQFIDLYKEYKSYQTVVTVNIERESIINLPAVAVCEKYTYKQYKSLQYYKLVKDVFEHVDGKNINCETNTGPCTPVNYFTSLYSQCTSFFNTFVYNNGTTKVVPEKSNNILDLEIDQWKLKSDEFVEIHIKKNLQNKYHSNEFTVAIIPSNSYPRFYIQSLALRQILLKFGRRYDVTFSKSKIIKLPKPYSTSCHDYKNDKNDKSYHHCVRRCLIGKFLKKYKCIVHWMDFILNDEFMEKKLCNNELFLNKSKIYKKRRKEQARIYSNWLSQCKNEICLPECIQEIYTCNIKDVTDSHFGTSFSLFNDTTHTTDINDTIIINILSGNTDVYTYIHHPKMTINDLLSKIGGLISLWFGFSFYSVYCMIESFIRVQLVKKASFVLN